MKPNTESTKLDRLRFIVGSALAILGVAIIIFVGAIYGYHHTAIWAIGLLFIAGGILAAKSIALANFLNDILRF